MYIMTRLGLLAYFSVILITLFTLGGALKDLWGTAYTINQEVEIMMSEYNTNFPDIAAEYNAIQPAAGEE